MTRSLAAIAAVPLLLAVGCSDPYKAVQEADTIEAYESFLKNNPNSPQRLAAQIRLEDLSLEAAREAGTLEAYDAFIARFPSGTNAEKAANERIEFLWQWADTEDTKDAWEKYIQEAKAAKIDTKKVKKARKRARVAESRSAFEVGPLEQEQVNLAENPDGPLDGWGFYTDVKNVGTEPISYFILRIDYLDSAGKVLDSDEQAACARYWNI
ncbi:MAG: hypothetical protein VX265_18105, partial [Myxococcota bacterium]|nr:hypothetical protein [Myxococcota bacterium]